MWKLYENFHIFHLQKRIISKETIRGNTIIETSKIVLTPLCIESRWHSKSRYKWATRISLLKNVGVTAVIQKANQLRKGIQRKEKKKSQSMLSGMAISPNKAWAKLSEAANLEENKVILALQRISCIFMAVNFSICRKRIRIIKYVFGWKKIKIINSKIWNRFEKT